MYHIPMNWIEERILEHDECEKRKYRITAESPKIFDALWTYITGDVNLANGTQYIGILKIDIEGNSTLRNVTIFRPSGRERREVNIALSQDKHSIQLSGAVKMTFPVRICPDGTVCLKDESDNRIEFKDAFRRILTPFLFPHLQGRKPDAEAKEHKPDPETRELNPEEQDAWRRMQHSERAGSGSF